MTAEAPRPSLARRVLLFPLVRSVIAVGMMALVGAPLFALAHAAKLDGGKVVPELIMAIASLAGLGFVVRVIERRPFAATLLPAREAGRDLAIGFGVGTALMATTVGILALAGCYRVTGLGAPTLGAALLATARAAVLMLFVGVFEETLFRGIVFRFLEDGLGSWAALALSAAIFGAVHLSGPGATAFAAVAIALEAGVLLSALYLMRRTLWLPIGTHWAWNLLEGPVFGCSVSGQDVPGLLHAETPGPALWTGGRFGPESGLVCVLVCTSVGVWLVVQAARAGRLMPPMWRRPRAEG
jgi:hypothetical protein